MVFAPTAVAAGTIGLVIAGLVYAALKRHSAGTPAMQDLAELIESGAMAFLRREYTVLLPFLLVVAALLAWMVSPLTALAYVLGGVCSVAAGLFGMKAATKANVRTSEAARESGQARALGVAFSGGAVMRLAVASLGLFGIGLVTSYLLNWAAPGAIDDAAFKYFSEVISGFAMGASSIALFARVGGGIYTKAADVGADLVGKVEGGIPEDDPRNRATIADLVGDNVGDCAGRGADLFESTAAENIGAMILAASLYQYNTEVFQNQGLTL